MADIKQESVQLDNYDRKTHALTKSGIQRVEYEELPEDFDQQTHAVYQGADEARDGYVLRTVRVVELPKEVEPKLISK